ncbi:hypothetical protein ACQPZZ_26035 [Microbispora sp. CA-135349]|uniref:hypothetical protein n=1 Tax=Microbispora sp. CA-135349 TaxID=3239953 RepID=UPI003D933166
MALRTGVRHHAGRDEEDGEVSRDVDRGSTDGGSGDDRSTGAVSAAAHTAHERGRIARFAEVTG